ncbi:MAG: ATP-grasp domain-containing protein [Lentisphaerae bacterium]|nr:ATP-grasp domain-containing protein [Lentisphaerota bacterium]
MTDRNILILPASDAVVPLILKAQAMGLKVVAADRDPNAMGLRCANVAETVSVFDCKRMLAVARQHRVEAVITEQTDAAVLTAAYVAEQMGLPGIGSQVAQQATDKWLMRECCRRAGIEQPMYRKAMSVSEAVRAAEEIGLPVVLKPSDSQASRGVAKVWTLDDVAARFPLAQAASRSGTVLVEDMMVGTESSVEAFIDAEGVQTLGICDKVKCAPPYSFDLQLIYPAAFDEQTMHALQRTHEAVVRAVGIRMGFTHGEYMVTENGVRLIEVAARGCGARVATELLPAMTGLDLLEARIRQALGERVSLGSPPRRKDGILTFLTFSPGRVMRVDGVTDAQAIDGVIQVGIGLRPGDRIGVIDEGGKRCGQIMAVGESRADVMAKAQAAEEALDVEIEAEEVPPSAGEREVA